MLSSHLFINIQSQAIIPVLAEGSHKVVCTPSPVKIVLVLKMWAKPTNLLSSTSGWQTNTLLLAENMHLTRENLTFILTVNGLVNSNITQMLSL